MEKLNPFVKFKEWQDEVLKTNEELKNSSSSSLTTNTLKSLLIDPRVAILSTVNRQTSQPSSRNLLIINYNESYGFLFETNYNSKKSKDIFSNPKVCLNFYWHYPYKRQVRIEGVALKLNDEISDQFFDNSKIGFQITYILSKQSEELLMSEEEFKKKHDEMKEQYLKSMGNHVSSNNKEKEEGKLKRPNYWGGFRIIPNLFEFYQSGDDYLSTRILYEKSEGTNNGSGNWTIKHLQT
ncbi:hypothetical protein ABK040_016406 [Willaertia magna]